VFQIRIRMRFRILTKCYTCWKNIFLSLFHASASLSLPFSAIGVIIFNILDSNCKFSRRRKSSLALLLMEMDTDPYPPKRCRSYRIRIHNTGQQLSTLHRIFFLLTGGGENAPEAGSHLLQNVLRCFQARI
jgi:hypothetical protein